MDVKGVKVEGGKQKADAWAESPMTIKGQSVPMFCFDRINMDAATMEQLNRTLKTTQIQAENLSKHNTDLFEALRAEKQKNLFDRKLFVFASMVQTWLAAPPAGYGECITRCRAAWIQGQAFLVSPSVLGDLGGSFNTAGSLAWQACDFCKTLSEFDQWPEWTALK